jgi:TolB-like protein/Flp pilus assembly protein TadD
MAKSSEWRRVGSSKFLQETGELCDATGQKVSLRPQTSAVLSLLISQQEQLVTKELLMEEVWKDTHVTDDSIVQCISEIRRALGPADGTLLITVPKKGYLLRVAAPRPTRDLRGRALRYLRWASVPVIALVAVLIAWSVLERPWSTKARIVVLPFINMSGDEEQEYFSDGLAEDLLTDLSKIKALTVISRTSTFGYQSGQSDLGEIARELGASHVVDGSVRREGGRLRISVQLVDTETGVSVWAERYDRNVTDVFDLQDEVRTKIIAALAVNLVPEDAARLSAGGTRTFAAYDLFLRGRHAETTFTREGIAEAIRLYDRAIELDPDYADAHARMANMYDFVARFGWSDDVEQDRLRALRMARKAVALDADSPFAHWTYGRIVSRLGTEGSKSQLEAIESLRRTLELDPNYADAHAFISLLYIGSGQPKEAVRAIETAAQLNPDLPFWYAQNRAIIHYMQGDFKAAVSDLERAAEQNPTAIFVHWWLAAAYAQAGLQEEADWQIEELRVLGFDSTVDDILASNAVIHHPPYAKLFAEGLRKAGIL